MKALRLMGISALAVGAIGAGTATAAPGSGSINERGTCLISVPGYPDSEGTAHVVITPSGKEHASCEAQLPAGATLPSKTLRISAGPCTLAVTPSGHVSARC